MHNPCSVSVHGHMDSLDEPLPGSAPMPGPSTVEDAAPRYQIPEREMGAVELPAIVHDVDRAIRAFGRVPSLAHVRFLNITVSEKVLTSHHRRSIPCATPFHCT